MFVFVETTDQKTEQKLPRRKESVLRRLQDEHVDEVMLK